MAHRITAECVAARLAESARGISSTLETLRDVHEDVRAGERANGADPAHALAQGESIVDEARRQASEIADTAERLASFSRGQSDCELRPRRHQRLCHGRHRQYQTRKPPHPSSPKRVPYRTYSRPGRKSA